MSPSCPISARRVDSNMVRVIAFQVALFTATLLFTQEIFFALVLLFDFAMRVARKPNLSPFHVIGRLVLEGWNIQPKLCDESPKRFALYMGLLTSVILILLVAAGLPIVTAVTAFILLVCALLETLWDFCIGCKIYYAIEYIKKSFKHDGNFY